jgi:hypothetical protein
MAKLKTEELIQQLRTDVERIRAAAQFFKESDKHKMVYSPGSEKWSVVQILEHLNAYSRYYLPAIQKAMTERPHPVQPGSNRASGAIISRNP